MQFALRNNKYYALTDHGVDLSKEYSIKDVVESLSIPIKTINNGNDSISIGRPADEIELRYIVTHLASQVNIEDEKIRNILEDFALHFLDVNKIKQYPEGIKKWYEDYKMRIIPGTEPYFVGKKECKCGSIEIHNNFCDNCGSEQ